MPQVLCNTCTAAHLCLLQTLPLHMHCISNAALLWPDVAMIRAAPAAMTFSRHWYILCQIALASSVYTDPNLVTWHTSGQLSYLSIVRGCNEQGALFAMIITIVCAPTQPSSGLLPAAGKDEEYDAFVAQHGQQHVSQADYDARRQLYLASKAFVDGANAREPGYTLELNRFSDWTQV